MRTIHFKNGDRKEIKQADLDIITKKISETGATFQALTNSNNQTYLVVNFNEVNYID